MELVPGQITTRYSLAEIETLPIARAGVIPYAYDEGGHLVFLFGRVPDFRRYYSDFGGRCENGETWIQCLFREVEEELGDVSLIAQLRDGVTAHGTLKVVRRRPDDQTLAAELFIRIPYDPEIVHRFTPNEEVSSLRWVQQIRLDRYIANIVPFLRVALKQLAPQAVVVSRVPDLEQQLPYIGLVTYAYDDAGKLWLLLGGDRFYYNIEGYCRTSTGETASQCLLRNAQRFWGDFLNVDDLSITHSLTYEDHVLLLAKITYDDRLPDFFHPTVSTPLLKWVDPMSDTRMFANRLRPFLATIRSLLSIDPR